MVGASDPLAEGVIEVATFCFSCAARSGELPLCAETGNPFCDLEFESPDTVGARHTFFGIKYITVTLRREEWLTDATATWRENLVLQKAKNKLTPTRPGASAL
jgi:hypothetical protein